MACAVEVPLNAIAWFLWGLSAVAVVVVASLMPNSSALAATAVLLGLAGATIHVRVFITDLEHRERAAFELGRDSVRPLR